MPVVIRDISFRRRREEIRRTPPAVAPVLVSASFDENALMITLTFDRAVDVSGLVGAQVLVNDGNFSGMQHEATGAVTVLSPTSVRVGLMDVQEWLEPGVTLTATGATGIVASDGGAAWAGVSNLELP